MQSLADFLSTFSIWSVLLPAAIGAFLFKKLTFPSKLIWGMTAIAVIPQLVRYFSFMKGHRYFVYNLYLIIEVALYCFYFFILLEEKKQRRIIYLFAIVFGCIYLILCYYKDITSFFFYEAVCVDNIFVVFFVLLIFYNLYSKNILVFNLKNPTIYYLSGMFFYAPISAIIYSLWDFLHNNPDSQLRNLYEIHYVANGLMYIFFSGGLIVDSKKYKKDVIL